MWLLEAMGSQEPARQLVLGVDSEEELVADSVDSEQRQQIVVAAVVGSSSCNAAAVVESFSSCLHPDLLQRQMMCLDIGNILEGHGYVFENPSVRGFEQKELGSEEPPPWKAIAWVPSMKFLDLIEN